MMRRLPPATRRPRPAIRRRPPVPPWPIASRRLRPRRPFLFLLRLPGPALPQPWPRPRCRPLPFRCGLPRLPYLRLPSARRRRGLSRRYLLCRPVPAPVWRWQTLPMPSWASSRLQPRH
jgi:hypothetical protein